MFSNATATIDQSVRQPDIFSCRGCKAFYSVPFWRDWELCEEFRRTNICARKLLAMAISAGAIQITVTEPICNETKSVTRMIGAG